MREPTLGAKLGAEFLGTFGLVFGGCGSAVLAAKFLTEDGIQLGIGFVAYSPLGRGFLSGSIKSIEDLDEDDYRRHAPRFQGDNFQKNLDLVEKIRSLAAGRKLTPSQLALAWVLHQGDDIVPIPGTKRRTYLDQNIAATTIELSDEELAALDRILPPGAASGERYAAQSIGTIDR